MLCPGTGNVIEINARAEVMGSVIMADRAYTMSDIDSRYIIVSVLQNPVDPLSYCITQTDTKDTEHQMLFATLLLHGSFHCTTKDHIWPFSGISTISDGSFNLHGTWAGHIQEVVGDLYHLIEKWLHIDKLTISSVQSIKS